MIQTVTGLMHKEDFGMTLCHEHFIVDLTPVRKDNFSKIETVEEVVPEIQKAMVQGIQAAIEVSTIDLARDAKKLKEIAEITGLHLVAATGYYLSPFHPAKLEHMSAQEIAQEYIHDLTIGMDNTDIKAGIIGEIASSPNAFVGQEKKILIAAGIAAAATGAAVSTHTGRYTSFETVDILLSQGVKPDKIIIGHQDLIDDPAYHLQLLEKGVNIAFDTCGKSAYMPDEVRAANAKKIVDAGYGDHLLLSNDISRNTYFTSHGAFGYTAVMACVVPKMRELGVKEEDIHKMLVENPARILDIEEKVHVSG